MGLALLLSQRWKLSALQNPRARRRPTSVDNGSKYSSTGISQMRFREK